MERFPPECKSLKYEPKRCLDSLPAERYVESPLKILNASDAESKQYRYYGAQHRNLESRANAAQL